MTGEFCVAELLGPQSVISAGKPLNNPCKPHIRFRSISGVEMGSAPTPNYTSNSDVCLLWEAGTGALASLVEERL